MTFSWHCPFCGHHSTIGRDNYTIISGSFNDNNKDGQLVLDARITVCPNPECREYEIQQNLRPHIGYNQNSSLNLGGDIVQTWRLRPQSAARPLPAYIPQAIIDDYTEACLIQNLSPKASATLARRCLQGMIRDFHGVKAGSLAGEIEQIKDKVDPVTWDSIDAVRRIGNIGAHMEKDINVIVDVEPEEAGLLIGLIESLIDDWYVARQQRADRHAAIQALADQKAAARKAGPVQSP